MGAGRTILVGWELGGGMGHLARLLPIMQDLRAQGWRVVAAMRDVKGARQLFADLISDRDPEGFQLRGGPFLIRSPETAPVRPLHSLGEALVWLGYADRRATGVVVDAWRDIARQVRPDVVLADTAPSLNAAVRGSIPLVAIGNGWVIPPPGPSIPLIVADHGDLAYAASSEERVGAAFESAARAPTDGLAGALRGDVTFACTPELLDPYRDWRHEPVFWPPLLPPRCLS
jgi:hypothetical protein